MEYETLSCEQRDQIAVLTLNRPDKRNALSRKLRDEIIICLEDLESNENVHVVIMTGAGDSFCAGFDLSEFQTGDMNEIFAHATTYHHKVYNCTKPIIAAINGPAMAGGMDLAAMCDLRIAGDKAIFGQPQVKMGIAAAFDLLRTVIPEPLARELCLTGRVLAVDEAIRCGFINEAVSQAELFDRAMQIASSIADTKCGEVMKTEFRDGQPDLFE